MSNITRRALRVYAALAELSPNGDDVLDALLPFFEPILELMNGRVFHPALFATGVRKLYRWRFTTDIAEQFIPRLCKAKYLEAKSTGAKGVYIVRFSPPLAVDDSPILGIVASIIDEFSKYATSISHTVEYKRSREELTDQLVRFLVSTDVYRPDNFAQEIAKMSLDSDEESELSGLEEGGQPLAFNDRYMTARFVHHICASRPDLVPHLARLASIGLLTEVVDDFLRPTQVQRNADLTVIVDAPLALDYLGCSGHAAKQDLREIFESLKAIGCRFVVFPVTLDEMQRNLRSMLSTTNVRRHGPTHEAIIRREVSEDFVKAVANDPQKALEQVSINVRQMQLDHFPSLHKFFPSDRYEDFFTSVLWVTEVAPREHDATCLALTMRLREGASSSDIFKVRYVFATRNPRFVRHSRNYCLQSKLINRVQEGPVVSQRELATVAWLRTGLGASEIVPRGHLLAACDRVLRVRPEVRDAVVERLKRFTPESVEEFELLLLDQKSLRRLADETLNDEKIVTDENAEQLFEAVKAAVLELERSEFEATLDAERERASSLIEQQRSATEVAQTEADRVTLELDRTRIQLQENRDLEIDQVVKLARRTSRLMLTVERFFVASLCALIVLGVLNYFTGWLAAYRIWSVVLSAVLAAFSLYHQAMNFLGRPKIALSSVLGALAHLLFERGIRDRRLDRAVRLNMVDYSGGKVRIREGAFIRVESDIADISEGTV